MRLIDADALAKYWHEVLSVPFYEDDYGKGFQAGLQSAIQSPTIEAEPVKHGRWGWNEDEFYMGLTTMTCSLCRGEWCCEDVFDIESLNYHYCPNCGAKMDEEGADG